MPLESLQIRSLRCIEDLQLQTHARWNWLVGANGAGKSTVLEALHILGTGQTWRHGPRNLLRDGKSEYLLSARMPDHFLALRRRGEEREIRYDGESIRSAWELLDIMPLQSLHSENSHFVAGSAEDRRRIMDWGIYYVDAHYGQIFREYRRALAQRNAWLKQPHGQSPWDTALAEAGESIQQRRQDYLLRVEAHLHKLWAAWSGSADTLSLHVQSGWKEGLTLRESLLRDLGSDREMGYTHSGPHRANLVFRIRQKLALDILSRGQLRVLGLAYRIAQLCLIQESGYQLPVILIDDFAAELDQSARIWWMDQLNRLGVQVFAAVTATDQIPAGEAGKQFYLAHGQLEKEIDR